MDYFNQMMFNPQYVNYAYWQQLQENTYNQNQSQEVAKAVKAMGDLCEAVKNMDMAHQEQAFKLCLTKMANEFGWTNQTTIINN